MVHRWRADSDAVAVGIGTVFADDPLLTSRLPGIRQPTRVVFDSQARLPLDSQLLASLDEAPVLVVTAPTADPGRLRALEAVGAEIVVAGGSSRLDRVQAALIDLGRRDLTSLFLEGGRTLASSFVAAEQVDRSHTFVAPLLLGSSDIGSVVPGPARLTALESSAERVGEDTLITARYREW
jgi:diaminohydroxyphosphoribosylaminopyrimidine deaminase/5-amino-6-(5-phosphoribosylamino)uracil reductase